MDGKLSNGALTLELCDYLASLTIDDLPDDAVVAGRRGVLDWVGCALAGSTHPALDILVGTLTELNPAGAQASVFGRGLKLGVAEAALANGQMGHVLDYDDTHLLRTTVLHTSSPVLAALFALSQRQAVDGKTFLLSYAVGFEAGVRVGQTAPNHLEGGWHLTGTLGSIAAAAAAGKLLGLDRDGMATALAIGATQAGGMQQNRGTMSKSFHAGKAASNGILAALLASKGFTSSLEIVEGTLGFSRIYSDVSEPNELVADLGNTWQIVRNGHKPYACGVVLHPVIDAVLDIRARNDLKLDDIDSIDVRVHPHVLSVTGVFAPKTGLQAKFSVFHSICVALIDGAAGAAQYTDARAMGEDTARLRNLIHVTVDTSYRKDQADAVVVVGAERFAANIEHATGTADYPMSDTALENKFLANTVHVIGAERARTIMSRVSELPALRNVGEIPALCQ